MVIDKAPATNHCLHWAVHQKSGMRVLCCSKCDSSATVAPNNLLSPCMPKQKKPNWDRLVQGKFPTNKFGQSRCFSMPFPAISEPTSVGVRAAGTRISQTSSSPSVHYASPTASRLRRGQPHLGISAAASSGQSGAPLSSQPQTSSRFQPTYWCSSHSTSQVRSEPGFGEYSQ